MNMAASATMQAMLASPFNRASLNKFTPSVYYVPCLAKRGSFRVRSMAEDQEKEKSGIDADSPKATTQPINPSPPPKPKAPKAKTGFTDIFAFSGPGPERINGRLAMIGFVTAIGVELANGQDLFAQLSNGGIPWFLGTSVVLSLASLVPLFKGVSPESKSDGFMTSDAEIWNGRFAMLGLIALAFTEYLKGGALV